MKNSMLLKKRLSLIYVICLVVIVFVSAIANSRAYEARLGSEVLTLIVNGLSIVFWIWMLIDLMIKITRGDQIQKPWLWIVFVVMTYIIGAFVYYIVIYYPTLSLQKDESKPA